MQQQDQPPPSQTPEASAATELTEEQKQLKAQKHSSGRGLIVPNKTQMVREVAVSPHHTLQLRHGDITKEDTIAIVTPTNETLYHTQGIAGTISRAAGRKVKKECDERVQLKGKVPITQVVISGNGNLPCKYRLWSLCFLCVVCCVLFAVLRCVNECMLDSLVSSFTTTKIHSPCARPVLERWRSE